jgi:hypothetical protein
MPIRIKSRDKRRVFAQQIDNISFMIDITPISSAFYTAKSAVFGFLQGYIYTLFGKKERV